MSRNPSDMLTVTLTLDELIECCAERALAKVGEVGSDSWDKKLALNVNAGVLDSATVKLTKRK